MAVNNGKMRFGHVAVDDQHWQPVVAPMGCNSYVIYNTGTLRVRTDDGDSTQELVFASGANPALIVSAPTGEPNSLPRFRSGDVIMFVRSSSGNETLGCVFVS